MCICAKCNINGPTLQSHQEKNNQVDYDGNTRAQDFRCSIQKKL